MKMVLLVVLASALLLFGCASAPQQQAVAPAFGNKNTSSPPAVQERTGAEVEPKNTTPAQNQSPLENTTIQYVENATNTTVQANVTKQQVKNSCSLALYPESVAAGDSVEVSYTVYSEGNTRFTYSCGDEVRRISEGGLTTGTGLCHFSNEGEQTVWIKADDEICAQKTLNVSKGSAKRKCYIDTGSVQKNLQSYSYSATVYFDGFKPGDKLVWVCDYTTASKTLAGDPNAGMPRMEIISCDFNGRPLRDAIQVSVGNVSCGEISTR